MHESKVLGPSNGIQLADAWSLLKGGYTFCDATVAKGNRLKKTVYSRGTIKSHPSPSVFANIRLERKTESLWPRWQIGWQCSLATFVSGGHEWLTYRPETVPGNVWMRLMSIVINMVTLSFFRYSAHTDNCAVAKLSLLPQRTRYGMLECVRLNLSS